MGALAAHREKNPFSRLEPPTTKARLGVQDRIFADTFSAQAARLLARIADPVPVCADAAALRDCLRARDRRFERDSDAAPEIGRWRSAVVARIVPPDPVPHLTLFNSRFSVTSRVADALEALIDNSASDVEGATEIAAVL